MNEDFKNYLKKEINTNYNTAINAKDFVLSYTEKRLKQIYLLLENCNVDDFIYLQAELKVIKGLQNAFNDIIIKQESINTYNDKVK